MKAWGGLEEANGGERGAYIILATIKIKNRIQIKIFKKKERERETNTRLQCVGNRRGSRLGLRSLGFAPNSQKLTRCPPRISKPRPSYLSKGTSVRGAQGLLETSNFKLPRTRRGPLSKVTWVEWERQAFLPHTNPTWGMLTLFWIWSPIITWKTRNIRFQIVVVKNQTPK